MFAALPYPVKHTTKANQVACHSCDTTRPRPIYMGGVAVEQAADPLSFLMLSRLALLCFAHTVAVLQVNHSIYEALATSEDHTSYYLHRWMHFDT